MAKSAQQRLNEFFAENAETREALKMFTEASYARKGSHSYAAGYLESVVVELIGQLPKAKRQEYRAQLIRAAQKVAVD